LSEALGIHLVGDVWVGCIQHHKAQEGVRCKLGETIEQPFSDILAHTPEVCKGAHLYNEYLAIQDGHDSWGMCTTSTECKTVLIDVLTVMSSMDPRMIR
jgi:hypothetical protein